MTVSLSTPEDPNAAIIDEFRANAGRVGGYFDGVPLLLLTTIGRRSGRRHTTPMVRLDDEGALFVFGTNAGRDNHPDWFRNLLDDARATVEVGSGDGHIATFAAVATPLEGDERDRVYARQAARDPAFAAYEQRTERTIPVVALARTSLGDSDRLRAIADQLARVHDDLRRELEELRDGATSDSGAIEHRELRAALARRCLAFCSAVREHHLNEDDAFDTLEMEFPELAAPIARLRTERREIAAAIDRLEHASARAATDREFAEIAAALDAHFAFEERTIVATLREQ